MNPIRVVQPEPRGDRQPTVKCAVPGCDRSTRERKTHCPEHITETTYVQRMMQHPEYAEAVAKHD